MEIKEHHLLQFIELYEMEFGIKLSRDEAYESAYNLVRLVKSLLKTGNYSDSFE